jgi:uroporphyrinogen-III decarboxylase
VEILAQGSPEGVYAWAMQALAAGATHGRFLLSSGGGLAPETPIENLVAMEKALNDHATQKND